MCFQNSTNKIFTPDTLILVLELPFGFVFLASFHLSIEISCLFTHWVQLFFKSLNKLADLNTKTSRTNSSTFFTFLSWLQFLSAIFSLAVESHFPMIFMCVLNY
jgi:hypothetical protein